MLNVRLTLHLGNLYRIKWMLYNLVRSLVDEVCLYV